MEDPARSLGRCGSTPAAAPPRREDTSAAHSAESRGLVALASALWVIAAGYADAAALPRAAGTGSWTMYHGDAAGTGVAARATAVDTAKRA
jgi:hypothetical protein